VLGYKEVSDYIGKKYSLQRAKELLKRNTRHYAKRQLTWFRREENAKWLELTSQKKDAELLKSIVSSIVNSR